MLVFLWVLEKGFVKGDPEGIWYGQWAPPTFIVGIDNSYQFQGVCILSEAESGKTLWNMKNISSALVKTIDMIIHKTLPEAQRTQDIESKTWIISKTETNANSNLAL